VHAPAFTVPCIHLMARCRLALAYARANAHSSQRICTPTHMHANAHARQRTCTHASKHATHNIICYPARALCPDFLACARRALHPSSHFQACLLSLSPSSLMLTLATINRLSTSCFSQSNCASSIPALSDFGALTALVVFCNYLLCALGLPAVLSLWWRFVRPLELKIASLFFTVGCPRREAS